MISAAGETIELRGLSTDKKPIEGMRNGNVFFEMDTCKVFMFDASKKKWTELK